MKSWICEARIPEESWRSAVTEKVTPAGLVNSESREESSWIPAFSAGGIFTSSAGGGRWCSVNVGSRVNRSWTMSVKQCWEVLRSNSLNRGSKHILNKIVRVLVIRGLNKPYLSVDCIISQIILLVRRPTLLKMRIRKTSRIFINTTSSELGSLPPNLERTNEFKTKFMLTQVAPRVGDCVCQVFHCAGDVRLGLVNHVAGQELVHGCQRQTCHILNIHYNF